ncbi:MAG: hypothetical protein PHT15_05800 [Gallionellaceae bacterium]|nr:hypothetical protein [Gallionellaceae bacterium]
MRMPAQGALAAYQHIVTTATASGAHEFVISFVVVEILTVKQCLVRVTAMRPYYKALHNGTWLPDQ